MMVILKSDLALALIGMLLIGASTRADTTGQQRAEAAGRGIMGAPAPRAVVKTIDAGKSFRLRNAGVKEPTVLVFLSPWCESYLETTRPAVSEQCRIAREPVEALRTENHVRWLGVASGLWATPEDLQEYRIKYKVTIPLTLHESGALFREFQVANTPTLIIADSQGKIVRRIDPGADETVAKALQEL